MTIRLLPTTLITALSLTFAACDDKHVDADEPEESTPMTSSFEGPRLSKDEYTHYGVEVAAVEATTTPTAMVADPASFEGKPVLMTGTVTNVCKSAGCWIMIGDGEHEVFVDTKHEFEMPRDCDGTEVVIEGIAGTREKSSGGLEPTVVASGIALKK